MSVSQRPGTRDWSRTYLSTRYPSLLACPDCGALIPIDNLTVHDTWHADLAATAELAVHTAEVAVP